jgi:hypothetical protein
MAGPASLDVGAGEFGNRDLLIIPREMRAAYWNLRASGNEAKNSC